MATSLNKIEEILIKANAIQRTQNDDLQLVLENVRWLTTIVLAEISGLVAYRTLIGANSLSLVLTFVAIILAFAILSFLLSALLTRVAKKHIADTILEKSEAMNKVNNNKDMTENNANNEVDEIGAGLYNDISKSGEWSKIFEIAGIVFLIGASFLGVISIFWTEILKVF